MKNPFRFVKDMRLFLLLIVGLSSCDQVAEFEDKARKINHYETAALNLARENRELMIEMSRLRDEIQVLKTEKKFLEIKLQKQDTAQASSEKKMGGRQLASIPPVKPAEDMVKFDVYKWSPSQILALAEKEFTKKNYEKSAQFFATFSDHFPQHDAINDKFLFQAGIASYESGNHPEWTLAHLGKLIKAYPTSDYYRGAKLWMALTYLQLGDEEKFFQTVEEFRKKYRNTDEWKVLSPHYEKIVQKFKKN